MKKMKYMLAGVLFALSVSCTSLEDDAQEAATLSKKSIEYTTEMDFEKAEKAYLEAQTFFEKYEKEGRLEEFSKAYNHFLRGE